MSKPENTLNIQLAKKQQQAPATFSKVTRIATSETSPLISERFDNPKKKNYQNKAYS